MSGPPKGYADLHNLPEDDRIEVIGKCVMENRQVVAFFVDNIPGKAERYIRKLIDKFPGIVIMDRIKEATAGAEMIKIGPHPEDKTPPPASPSPDYN